MLKNYLKVALRSFFKHKGYSFINVTGLATGIACCILILLWVQNELSFDKFHENADNLYLVCSRMTFGDTQDYWGTCPPITGPTLKAEYPEIVNSARRITNSSIILAYGDKQFEEQIYFTDPALLEMFSFPIVHGNSATALREPHSFVLTEKIAEKYFGTENPVGKTIRMENKYNFVVTGILKDIPQNSFIQFDILAPIVFLEEYRNNDHYLDIWDNYSFRTYVQLQENVSPEDVEEKIAYRIKKSNEIFYGILYLRPFTSLRLHWLGHGGSTIKQVRIFTIIAFLILLIACINFMNLTTARSSSRAREIGMRKVVGASKKHIIRQFYGESVFLSFFALLFALILVFIFLPFFNNLSGKILTLDFSGNSLLIPGLFLTALVTGIIAGSYPALYLSSFQPVKVLKGKLSSASRGAGLRKILVVTQFALSIVLIIGTTVIYSQLNYIRNKNLGFDKEHLIYLPLNGDIKDKGEAAKLEMLRSPDILHVSNISHLPTGSYTNNAGWNWEGKDPNVDPLVTRRYVDYDFLETFGSELSAGTFYSPETITRDSRTEQKIIINETFAKIIGAENPVGMQIAQMSEKYTVIGVIKDFHFEALYQEIEPLALSYSPKIYGYMFLRISPENIPETISYIENVFTKYSPGFPFIYNFFDEVYDILYRAEVRTGSIIKYFTILAIIISCLGLFGLASYMAEQRTKEVGIRRALGASVPSIFLLFSKDFAKWILLANIIAWPAAYYAMHKWLQSFAYRISPGIGIFIFSAVTAFFVALLTICYQSVKTARANPLNSLKYE